MRSTPARPRFPDALFPPFHTRGIPLGQVYGATETGPVSIYLRAEDAMRKVGSAGKAAIHCDVRLVGDDGREVVPGEVGEIRVRAPNVMQGYWKDPHNAAFEDGWFKTGDLARQDDEGFYWVVGRSKDMIISGGENIYPAEIEHVLAECDGYRRGRGRRRARRAMGRGRGGGDRQAAIQRAGRGGRAATVRGAPRAFQASAARRFCRALPKNALGKVQKAELQRELALIAPAFGTPGNE